jgi:hypothetical protein
MSYLANMVESRRTVFLALWFEIIHYFIIIVPYFLFRAVSTYLSKMLFSPAHKTHHP